jgi:integrase/recombinase XerD
MNQEITASTAPPISLKSYLQKRYATRTAICYESDINIYTSNFKNAETATNKNIMTSLESLRKRYTNPKTLIKFLSAVKAYYQFLVETGIRNDHPAQSIFLKDKSNTDIQLQDLFSTEELEALLVLQEKQKHRSQHYFLMIRNKVILTLLIYQGIQISELSALMLSDIDLHKGTVFIASSLISNSRTLALKAQQILLFYEYIHQVRPQLQKHAAIQTNHFVLSRLGTPHYKNDISHLITRNFKQVYFPRNLTAQTIRQSVITNLLKSGHDLRVIQVFAGHKNPSTTEKYKQTSVEELKTAIQNYHPFS